MAPPTTATDFLRALGTNSVPHGSRFLDLKHGSFFDHLVGTYEVLERWGAATSVCLAGMYHSVYGTEGFQGFTLPISERSAVADVIGGRAEFAAFINCAMDRDSLDSLALAHIRDEKRWNEPPSGPLKCRADLVGQQVAPQWTLTAEQFVDVAMVHLADACESFVNNNSWAGQGARLLRHAIGGQPGYYSIVAGSQWSYRRAGYTAMAEVVSSICPAAEQEWESLQAQVAAGVLGDRGVTVEWHAGPIPSATPTDVNLSAARL